MDEAGNGIAKGLRQPTTRRQLLRRVGAASALPAALSLAGASSIGMPALVRAASKVELQYWWPVSPTEPEYADGMAVVDAWNKAHPDVVIKPESVSWEQLENKVTVSTQGGNPPDVVWALAESITTYQRMGILADRTQQWNSWADKAAIWPQAISSITFDGKIVSAMPHYLGLRAFLYHNDLFTKAGVTAPPKTWDELMTVGKQVQQATGVPAFGFCGQSVRQPQELIVYLWQNDLDIAVPAGNGKFRNTWQDKSDELARATEVFQFYADLVANDVVPKEATSWGYQELDTNLAQAGIASAVDGPWMSSYEQDNPKTMPDIAIAPIPYKRTPATFLEVNYLVTFKGSKHPEEAWQFLEFVASKQVQSMANYKDRSVRKDVQPTGSKWVKPFIDLIPQGKTWPQVSLGQITLRMIDAVQRVLLHQSKPQEAAAWLSDQVNAALKEQGEA